MRIIAYDRFKPRVTMETIDALAFSGDAILTDVATLTGLLAR
jgi:hypothetical protein